MLSAKTIHETAKTSWHVAVPKILNTEVEEALKTLTYATKSDFIRDAVRRKLEDLAKVRPLQEARRNE